jgi:hypothetical protein
MYIPNNRYVFWSMKWVMMAPTSEPTGKMPIKMDCAANFPRVIEYLLISTLMGTEVISFRLYPYMTALRDRMSPTKIFLALFLRRSFS